VSNFAEIYATLDDSRGALSVADEDELTTALAAWLAKPAARSAVAAAASATVATLSGALERTLAALDPYLMQLRRNGRTSAAG
jgi:3-deoxy-D-manno-octulosonic-acid transferase